MEEEKRREKEGEKCSLRKRMFSGFIKVDATFRKSVCSHSRKLPKCQKGVSPLPLLPPALPSHGLSQAPLHMHISDRQMHTVKPCIKAATYVQFFNFLVRLLFKCGFYLRVAYMQFSESAKPIKAFWHR